MPYNIQNEFLKDIINNTQSNNPNKNIYGELVKLRFSEVIKSTFPIYVSYTENKILEKQIANFIIYGSHTTYVWQISYEFIEYLLKTNQINNIQKEILNFEKEQIKIYISNKHIKSKIINQKRAYRLSANACILKHNYNIIEQTFEKKTNYILIYKNIDDLDVYHVSLTKFMYIFLNKLRNNNTIENIIKQITKQMNINYIESYKVSFMLIKNLVKDGIII
jgi:hypothetical protein